MESKENTERIEYYDDRWYKMELSPQGLEKLKSLHEKEFQNPVYLPSSTTALGIVNKPFLARWRGDIGNEAADFRSRKAKDIGSRSHDGIHRLFMGETLKNENYIQEEWVNINRFWLWYQSLGKPSLPYEPEMTVYSLEYLYAGTLDFVCSLKGGKYNIGLSKPVEIEGGIYIGDLKTGKNIDFNAFRQLASYWYAFQEITQISVQGAFILHTQAQTKEGWKMILRTKEELAKDFQAFLHALELWKDENQGLTPVIFDMPKTINLYEKEAL